MRPEIVYQDEDYLIVNKPAGITVIPDRSEEQPALNRLLEQSLKQKIWVVHRIDRQTSGAVCFAKNEAAHRHLSGLFQSHAVEKIYQGLVSGRPAMASGTITGPIAEHPSIKGKMIVAAKGKPSVTEYRMIKQWPLYALLEFRIHTGRTHQIRVHMQSAGHPILCDELYSTHGPFFLSAIKKKYRLGKEEMQETPLLSRLALHAHILRFRDRHGKEVFSEVPLPKDMAACVKQLDKWSR